MLVTRLSYKRPARKENWQAKAIGWYGIGVTYFPVSSDQMVTQFPLQLSTKQEIEIGMYLAYASNNPQIILLWCGQCHSVTTHRNV
jgi:hypothetical protein